MKLPTILALLAIFTAALRAEDAAVMTVAITSATKGSALAFTEAGQRVAIQLPSTTPPPKFGSIWRVRVKPRGEPIQAKAEDGSVEWVPYLDLVPPQPDQTGLAGILSFKVTVQFQAEPGFFAKDDRGGQMFILTRPDYKQPAEGSRLMVKVKPTGKKTVGKSGVLTDYLLVE